MCFGGTRTKTSTSTSTSSSSIPKNITELTNKVAGKAGELLDSEYVPYTGDRVAELSNPQQSAISGIQSLYGNQPIDQINPTVQSYINQSGTMPAQTIGSQNVDAGGRIVDENGALGSVSSYMDPYLNEVLQPTLQAIDEAGMNEHNRIGAAANMSGAFGDARHGILEGQNAENIADARARATADLYSGAFNNAMNLRGQDLGRFLQTDFYNADSNRAMDVFNAQQGEREADRLYQAGMGLQSVEGTRQSANLQALEALFGLGTAERGIEQMKLDADYGEHLKQEQDPYNVIAAATGAVSGLPYERSQTTTTTQQVPTSNNSGWSAIGGLIGGLF